LFAIEASYHGQGARRCLIGGVPTSWDGAALAPRSDMTADRIDPDTARAHIASSNALLVCAYDSAEKCQQIALDGAIGLDELDELEARMPRQQEIIFYCA
jgi:hypothetical protein